MTGILATLLAIVTQPRAQPDLAVSFETLPVIDDNALSQMRGGLRIGGLDLQIGARMRTFIDGSLVLQSRLNLTESGLVPITPADIPASQAITPENVAWTRQDAIPDGITLPDLPDARSVIVNDNKGLTVALQQASKDRILSVLVNTSNGRQIRHQLDLDITVANFREYQQTMRSLLRDRILQP